MARVQLQWRCRNRGILESIRGDQLRIQGSAPSSGVNQGGSTGDPGGIRIEKKDPLISSG
eukprot:9749632-Karenia_brevis.AAC.1